MTRIAIIGSGIAGASVAYALRRYGTDVTVFEQHGAIAPEASGNPAALVMPRLDVGDTPVAQLHRDSFIHAVRLYEHLNAFLARGVTDTTYDAAKIDKLMANPPLPADWLQRRGDSLFHAKAGSIDPRATITHMLEGCTIHLNTKADPAALNGFDAIVIASGRLLGLPGLEYRLGQVDTATGDTSLQMGESYVIAHNGILLFGATHDHWHQPETVPAPTAESTARNIANLHTLTGLAATSTGARTALRVATKQRVPLAGRIAHRTYAIGALGSRGFTTAPWLGEHVAAQILGIPNVLTPAVQAFVAPHAPPLDTRQKAGAGSWHKE